MKGKSFYIPTFLAALAILLTAFSASSYATETRAGSMGGVGFYMRDNSNVFFFPSTICRYSNQMIAELRVKEIDSQYSIGAHLPIGASKTFGIYLNRPLSVTVPATGMFDEVRLDRGAELLFGCDGEPLDFGIRLLLALDRYSDETDTIKEEQSARYLALSGGISTDLLDVSLMFELPSAKYEMGDEEDKWGGFGLGMNGRLFVERTPDLHFVPLATFYYQSSSCEYDAGVPGVPKEETDYGLMNLGIGIGLNWQPNEDNLVVLGIEGFGLSRATMDVKDGDEFTTARTILPGIYVGLESAIKPWLTGRMGAAQVYQKDFQKIKPPVGDTTEFTSYETAFKLTFGLGVSIGSFALDATVNEGLLFDGPNFISGSTEVLANRISLTYKF